MTPHATPEQLLERFGLDRFRPGQREAVQAALDGRDSLVVMPTGGGKSLCYQLPALADAGLVVVVSPLIALMSDQWQRLQHAGVRAAMLASGMADGHNEARLREIESGETQLVLAAPERFASSAFRRALAARRVALFVVDEAHCVAEWGHDFRPDYLRLHDAIETLSGPAGARPAVMAATATATPRVAKEIAARLGLRDPVSVRSGFDRPNIAFDVVTVEGKGAMARKRAALLHVLRGGASGVSGGARAGADEANGAGAGSLPAIVYCGTRRDTEQLAAELALEGFSAVAYHGGMDPDARRRSQADFMDGRADVVVATNAFGMGVDKADVRTVAHWALPTSLEAYYQEAGRGGRDGLPARALLLASRSDLGRLIRFIKERETTVEDVRAYVAALRRAATTDADGRAAVTVGHGQLGERARVLMSIAERAGALELQPAGAEGLLVRLTGAGSPRLARAAIAAARDRAWEAYRSIERFGADGQTCRRRQILDHFGDPAEAVAEGRCCDVCDPDASLAQAVLAAPVSARRGGVRTRAAAAREDGADVPAEQFDALRAWRMGRAEGKPAYTVTTDAALREVLLLRPASLRELGDVRGIGPAFCEKHGESLIAALGELGGAEHDAHEHSASEGAGEAVQAALI